MRAQVQGLKESRLTIRRDEDHGLASSEEVWTSRHIVPIALLVRVRCFWKDLYKAVEEPSTRLIVLSMITGSYIQRPRRLTIFQTDETKNRFIFDPP